MVAKVASGKYLYLPPHMAARQLAYRNAMQLRIMVRTNPDRQVLHAIIAFPDLAAAYTIQDQAQLKAVIEKLQDILEHMVAKGESKILSFEPD